MAGRAARATGVRSGKRDRQLNLHDPGFPLPSTDSGIAVAGAIVYLRLFFWDRYRSLTACIVLACLLQYRVFLVIRGLNPGVDITDARRSDRARCRKPSLCEEVNGVTH